MTEARMFTPEDLPAITRWLVGWGRVIDPSLIPGEGIIVPGVAAGFLYRCDAPVGIVELMVTNPEAAKEVRDVALDLVISGLVDLARARGCRVIWGVTDRETLARRAGLSHGFEVDPRRFFWMERSLP